MTLFQQKPPTVQADGEGDGNALDQAALDEENKATDNKMEETGEEGAGRKGQSFQAKKRLTLEEYET